MSESQALPQDKFGRLYQCIAAIMESASAELRTVEIAHEEGRARQQHAIEAMQDAGARFREDLALLERHAEWERLTVAFFGETNAGKSTLVESLRILLGEESRQEALTSAKHDLVEFEQRLDQQAALVLAAAEAAETELAEAHQSFEQSQSEAMRQFKLELCEAIDRFEKRQLATARDLATKVLDVRSVVEAESSRRVTNRLRTVAALALLAGASLGALSVFLLLH
jgi:hypothetical protein